MRSRILLIILLLFAAPNILAQPELDTTFNSTGMATASLGLGGATDVAVQSDRKAVAVGGCTNIDLWRFAFCLARFNENGTLDSSFNGGTFRVAIPGIDLTGNAGTGGIAVQSDGKLVLAGFATYSGQRRVVVARLNQDGSNDSTFGTGGIVSTDIEPGIHSGAADVAIQDDGKILIAGTYGPVSSPQRLFAARYTANGTLDATFGTGGVFRADLPGFSTQGRSLAIGPAGTIIIGGAARNVADTSVYYLVVRLNPNGTPDTNWDGDGYKSIQYSTVSSGDEIGIRSVAAQPDGRIVALGYPNVIYRFLADGSPDLTFDSDGARPAWPSANHEPFAVFVTPNGKITATGNTLGSGSPSGTFYRCTVARYLPDGSPDTSFSGDGYFTCDRGNSGGRSVVVDRQGRIVVAGLASNSVVVFETPFFFVFRLKSSPNYRPFDFDADGKSDISIFRPSSGQWWLEQSGSGTVAHTFGGATDRIAPGDYTGDGRADVAVYRPASGEWLILRSEDFTYYSFPFGSPADIPVSGDFDGDGKTDAAVYRPANGIWFILRSGGGTTIESFGIDGDQPVASDYDGDGITDIAVFRPSNGQWWLKRSSAGIFAVTFGTSTDRTVPGDYTGDGRADIALYRPSTGEWLILRSEDFSFYSFPFGIATDTPAPGDYDGDGRFDAAVFRSSAAIWYVQRSTAGLLIRSFGAPTDLAVPNAFVR